MIKKNIDQLYICMYSLMRGIKKERANQDLASNFLGICFAFNVNTLVTILILIIPRSSLTGKLTLFVPLTFILFYFFNQKYFIKSGRSRKLIIELSPKDHSSKRILSAVFYILFSIDLL